MFEFLTKYLPFKSKKMAKDKAPQSEEITSEEAVELNDIDRLRLTNDMLKKIQTYFYFRGDRFAEKQFKENNEFLETAKENRVSSLLKASNVALKRVHDNCYQANDYFLNDVIQVNDKFLSKIKK